MITDFEGMDQALDETRSRPLEVGFFCVNPWRIACNIKFGTLDRNDAFNLHWR
jgi:hypothetical protein